MLALLVVGMLHPQDPAAPKPDSIWDRLSFYADGRLRAESTFDQPNGEDRHRGRMRFRVGANYQVTEDVRAEARLSTAADGNDSNNPHWDFGDGADGFKGAQTVLDRFYLDWKANPDLSVRGGKMPHAFTGPPVFSEFMWDGDVQPAGVTALWASKADDGSVGFDLRAAGYVAVENGADNDPTMGGLQANLYLQPSKDSKVQVSASYSKWGSLDAAGGALANQGNTDVAGDFGILEGFVSGSLEGGPLDRTTLFVQAMHNGEHDDNEGDGLAVGAQLGKSGKKGDANVFAVWYDLEANSIFSPVAQDDTPISGSGVGSGMEGVILGWQYFITENLSIKVWALTSDADAADDPVRYRLDLDFRVR